MELSRVPPAPAPAQVEATLRAVCGAPPDFGVTALRAGAPVGSGPFGPSTEAIVRAADAVAEEAADEMELAEAPPADAALAAVVAVAQPPTAKGRWPGAAAALPGGPQQRHGGVRHRHRLRAADVRGISRQRART
jgi:hypothetical protein